MMFRKAAVLLAAGSFALAALPMVQSAAQTPVVTLNGTVHVVKADVLASNGVVHVIDGVLTPPAPATMAATMSATMAATMEPTLSYPTPAPATMAATMAPTMAATMSGTALPTIADIVAGNPDFSTLLAALQAAKLADTFAKPGTYTVFAPTNEAFAAFLSANNMTAAQALANTDLLTKILTYHVAGTVIKAADLSKMTSVTTLNGASITVSITTGAAATMAGTMAAAGGSTTVSLGRTDALGSFLVGPNGHTLYTFKNDVANSGKSACSGGCAAAWPPLTVASGATPSAASGISGKLGTITLADGTLQVTYNGLPLYFFKNDAAAGDTKGQGVGGVWSVAAP